MVVWWTQVPYKKCSMSGSSRQVYKGPFRPSPKTQGIPGKGMGRGLQSCRGKGASFWTAEDHCKHAFIGAAVTCAVQVSRHPIRVGRGSCGPTLAEDSCQWKESRCSSEVPPLAGEPWGMHKGSPDSTKYYKKETKKQEVELFKKQNKKELGWRYREVGCPGSSWRWEGNIVKYMVSA